MKVLNLQCSRQHSFEGWFGSEGDFQDQLARSLIECPLCADKQIQKMPSAPRLNLGAQPAAQKACNPADQTANSSAPTAVAPLENSAPSSVQLMPQGLPSAQHAAFLNALRHVVKHTEDVGQRFADEARRMHYGEVQARNIRGQTSVREAVELLEEGIEVMPLPMLPALKETLQ
ncbi:MAG: DUF1178 family protein [Pseudomonadota bacterium]|nr:DUF1178 family protein [Pseudomonadota bacterium]